MERRDFLKLGAGTAIGTALPDISPYRPEVITPYVSSDIAYFTVTQCRIPSSLDECFELMDKEEVRKHLSELTNSFISHLRAKQEVMIYY